MKRRKAAMKPPPMIMIKIAMFIILDLYLEPRVETTRMPPNNSTAESNIIRRRIIRKP